MARKQPFTVRLSPENKAFVASASAYFGLSQADFIDRAVTEIRKHADRTRPELSPDSTPKALEGGSNE